ncbi:MAG TPA: MFS transporter [Streptosporangiaceae bacterium]|nr:MFS transporter [Streptosporangiaceae bacterium]
MTDVCASSGAEQQEQADQGRAVREPGEPGGSSYLAVLRVPGALRFTAAGAVGRMTMSMFGLGSLLLISARTGRFGLAGVVAAAGSVSYAVCAPKLASLADRFGQGRVLRPTAGVFGVATAAFVACAQLRAPLWALLISSCLTGASMPSLGSMVRARWSALLADSAMLGTAYALESVVDELIFVIGPALATLLATEVQPAAGVVTAAVLGVAGTLALAGQGGTEPAIHPGLTGVTGRRAGGRAGGRRRAGGRLPAAGLITLAPLFCFLGSMFASIDLSTVAFAQQHGHRPLAGLLLGTYALGSATGGLWYGSRSWRAPLERRFAITLCLTVAGVATFWSLPGLRSLALVIFFSGLTISPTLIAGFSLIERQAPPGRRTEGMTWLSSAIAVGLAAGSAIAGHIVDAGGARWGYVFAAGCGGLAAVVCIVGLGRLRAVHAGQAAQ